MSDILRGMLQRKMLMIVPPVMGLLLAGTYANIAKPRYIAEAQLVIENQASPFDKATGPPDPNALALAITDHMVASQVNAAKSDDIIRRVVSQLGLEKNPDYNINLAPPGTLSALAVALGFADNPALFGPKEMAAKSLTADLTVYGTPDSNIIGVKSTAHNAADAAATANAIAETYVQSTREAMASANARSRDWIGQQLEDLRRKVAESDKAVEDYRALAGLLRGTSGTLTSEQLSQLNQQIVLAETARADAVAKAEAIKKAAMGQNAIDASSEALASPLMQALKQQQLAAETNLAQLSVTYLPNHPKMVAAQQQLDIVNRKVRAEALKLADSLQNQADIADQRAASLRNQLDGLKSSQASNGVSDVKLQALEREAAANRELLQSMLGRYADASGRVDANTLPSFARIIQRAAPPPAPYFPKPGPTMALGLFAGLFLGMGLAFVLEVLKPPQGAFAAATQGQPLADQDDLPPEPRPASAATPPGPREPWVAPEARRAAFYVASPQPLGLPTAMSASAAQALLRGGTADPVAAKLIFGTLQLADRLMQMSGGKRPLVIGLSSMGVPPPNAAMAAIGLGRALAQAQQVLVLDLAQSVEAVLNVVQGRGLADVLWGGTTYPSVINRDAGTSLHWMGSGGPGAALDFAGLPGRMPGILATLQAVYPVVLVNLGEARASVVPLIAGLDAAILLSSQAKMRETMAATQAIEEAHRVKTVVVPMLAEGIAPVPQAMPA